MIKKIRIGMKLRNIISSFCLLLLAVSCSMDDDMLNDVDRGIMEAGEMYTAFTFDLSTRDGLETKAGTDPLREEEGKITKCYVVIANGDHIIGSHTYLENEIDQSDGEYQLTTHLTIKVPASAIPSSLTAFVVAYAQDSENNDFSTETSLKALKEKVISNPLTDFVKVGEATGITGYKTSDKMSDFHNTDYCKAVQVALVMRAAAIELKEIKAKFMVGKEEMPLSVEVTSMTIDRQITNTLLDGQVENPRYQSDASMGGLDTRFYT